MEHQKCRFYDWISMKLRNFMYLNTKILEDYISVIDGFTYDEESQEIQNVNEKTLGGSAGVKIISGNGEIATKKVDEVKRSVHISDCLLYTSPSPRD